MRKPHKLGRLVLFATAATPLGWVPGGHLPSTVGSAGYFRILIGLVAVSVVWTLFSRRVAYTDRDDQVLLALLVYIAVMIAASVLGESPTRSLYGDFSRMGGVIFVVYITLFYVLARAIFDEGDWLVWFRISIGVAVTVALVAICQRWFPGNPLLPPTGSSLRPSGTLPNSGYLGAYLLVMTGIVSWRLLSVSGNLERLLLVTTFPILGGAFILAGSAAAGIGLIVSLLFVVVSSRVWPAVSTRLRRASGYALTTLGMALTVGAFLLPGGSGLLTKMVSFGRLEEIFRGRAEFWLSAGPSIAANPILGVGPENFEIIYGRHFPRPERYTFAYTDRAHNIVVEALAGTGILGTAALVVLWAAAVLHLWRTARSGRISPDTVLVLGAVGIGYFVYLAGWWVDISSLLPLVAAAGYVRFCYCGLAVQDRGGSDRQGWRSAVAGALVVMILLGSTYRHGVRLIQASYLAGQAASTPTVEERIALFSQVVALGVPEASEVRSRYASYIASLESQLRQARATPERRAFLSSAIDDADDALRALIVTDPSNYRWFVARGDLHRFAALLLGDGDRLLAAAESYLQAIELSPNRADTRLKLAAVYDLAGRSDLALRTLEDADSVAPGSIQVAVGMAQLQLELGDPPAAGRALLASWRGGQIGGATELLKLIGLHSRAGEASTAAELAAAYLGSAHGYPGGDPALRLNSPEDRSIALRLPLLHLRAGDEDAALTSATWVSNRLRPAHSMIERFRKDVLNGWGNAWAAHESLERAGSALGRGPLTLDGEHRR